MSRAKDYEHLPLEQIQLEWQASGSHLLSMAVAIHPNTSGRIIINYPGYRGSIDGFNQKHRKLAYYMQGERLGAVVRIKGPGFPDFDRICDDIALRKILDYSLENAEAISGVQKPEILLIGTSAGGGAVAAVAADYERVSKMLLMAPGANIGMKLIREGLRKFTGEVYVVIGKQDEGVGVGAGRIFHDLAIGASHRELKIIPNCDHQFKGQLNGRIMSQAPFYAFARGEKPKFPDSYGGIILY